MDERRLQEKLNKPRMSLLPGDALLEVAKVLGMGADKHGAFSWRDYPAECYIDAIMRHWCAVQEGELVDSESGLSHFSHIAASALFLTWFYKNGIIKEKGEIGE